MGNLGCAHAALRDPQAAVDSYQHAGPACAVLLISLRVAYQRELGHPDAEADARTLDRIRARLGRP